MTPPQNRLELALARRIDNVPGMTNTSRCMSCLGSGEAATDYGVVDCPDCGGSGTLPTRATSTAWRAADIERAVEAGNAVEPAHVKWLLTELGKARAALTEIIALAHDTDDPDALGLRIRFTANRALGLYEVSSESRDDG